MRRKPFSVSGQVAHERPASEKNHPFVRAWCSWQGSARAMSTLTSSRKTTYSSSRSLLTVSLVTRVGPDFRITGNPCSSNEKNPAPGSVIPFPAAISLRRACSTIASRLVCRRTATALTSRRSSSGSSNVVFIPALLYSLMTVGQPLGHLAERWEIGRGKEGAETGNGNVKPGRRTQKAAKDAKKEVEASSRSSRSSVDEGKGESGNLELRNSGKPPKFL